MEWLFGRRMTPDEMLRKNQRALTKAMRELDREKSKMEQQEKKIIMDIKKMAKQGQMDAVKVMAKVSGSYFNLEIRIVPVLKISLFCLKK
jgi:charged multivesicular body protein 2A